MELIRQSNLATTITFPLISSGSNNFFTGTAFSALTNGSKVLYTWTDSNNPTSATLTNNPIEVGSTGIWYLNLTQAETSSTNNFAVIKLKGNQIQDQSILIHFTNYQFKNIADSTNKVNTNQVSVSAYTNFPQVTVSANLDKDNYTVSGGWVQANVLLWQGDSVNPLQSGRVDSYVGNKGVLNDINGSSVTATSVTDKTGYTISGNINTLDGVADIVETQKTHHTWSGKVYYVDGYAGVDATANGSRDNPYKTITSALAQCVSNRHDLIILKPNTNGNPNVFVEPNGLTINKNYVFIRGMGRDTMITRSGNGDVVTINANGVEIGGVRIQTSAATANYKPIQVTNSDFVWLHDLWIESQTGSLVQDAININVAKNGRIERNTIIGAGRTGVRVESGAGTGYYNIITDNIIRDSLNGIELNGSDASECRIQRNIIRDNTTGITIASGVLDTIITDNRYINNTTWLSDSGTRTLNMFNEINTDSLGRVTVSSPVTVSAYQNFPQVSVSSNSDKTGYSIVNQVSVSAIDTSVKDDIVDRVWDETLTGATHNVANSSGKRLRQLASTVVWDGTAQGAGVNGNQIILDNLASSINGAYDPALIAIVNGTGAGQCRLILEYNGSTKTATVDRNWKVNPDNTSEFIIYADAGREHVNEGLITSSTNNTAVLNANASSNDDVYVGQLIFLRSGTGDDQVKLITNYNGTTKTITIHENWAINPDNTTGYVILPNHIHTMEEFATAVWDSNNAYQDFPQVYVSAGNINNVTGNVSGSVNNVIVPQTITVGEVTVSAYNNFPQVSVSAMDSNVNTSISNSILNTVIDVKTLKEVMEILLAMADGKIVRVGDTFQYFKQDNNTSLFTNSHSTSARDRI
jgi:hypothetical protein